MASQKIKTLKEICLQSIVINFEIFTSAYISGVLPRKYFDFLQRIFSKELLHTLCEKQELKDEYINFLINPYLKELDLRSCKVTNWQSVTDRLQLVGSTITTLNLTDAVLNENEDTLMNLTTYLPNVEVLILCRTGCKNEVLKNIAKFCPLVTVLDISFCTDISDEGLLDLCIKDEEGKIINNNILQHLDVRCTEVTKVGVQCILQNFHSLKTLKYEALSKVIYEIHEADFVNNSLDAVSKYGLEHMEFIYGGYSHSLEDSLKMCSIMCPNINTITVDSLSTEAEVQILCEFSHLTSLISSCNFHGFPSNFTEFLKLKGRDLQNLELSGGTICAKLLSEYCSRLQNLRLREIEFSQFSKSINVSSMPRFPQLTKLSLEVDFVLESTVESAKYIISSSPKLEILSLQNSLSFTESIADYLLESKSLTNLIELDLSGSDVPTVSVQKLIASAIKLEKLSLEYCDSILLSDFESLQQLVNSVKNSIEIVWTDCASDQSFSGEDYDLYNNYDIDGLDFDHYGYDIDGLDFDHYDYENEEYEDYYDICDS